jgi:hypothetical protein
MLFFSPHPETMMRQIILFAILSLIAQTLIADEGMWTLDNFPSDRVNKKYNVNVDQDWLDQIRLSTTRIEGGCTGSFVSPDGLVLTNHHCVRRCIRARLRPMMRANNCSHVSNPRVRRRPKRPGAGDRVNQSISTTAASILSTSTNGMTIFDWFLHQRVE